MNILTDYNAIAERLYTERIKRGRTLSEDIYREWYLSLSLSSLAGIEQERKKGTFDEQQYKNILLNTFESCRKFIDHLDSISPGNKCIIYLQNVCKALTTDFYMFIRQEQDATLPPAFMPFLDTVETLRQLSYILTGPRMTPDSPYRHPPFWAFCTVNMNSVNKVNYTEHFKSSEMPAKLTGKKEDLIIPTEEEVNNAMAFLKGPLLTFMYDHFFACGPQSIETLLIYPIFTTDTNEPVCPIAPGPGVMSNARPVPTREGIIITPEECYSEEQRNRYMEELKHLEQKRDENALLLLEQADQSSFDAEKEELFPANIPGAILPELVIYYKILQTVLPYDKAQADLTDKNNVLQSLFPDTYYVTSAEQKNVRNMSITKATKRLIRAYTTVNISGKGLLLKNDKGEVMQEVAFADATGKPSDQVIDSFDMSIADCVGSLQQKNPNRNYYTDIEIAKEFNSTEDKKGHITPDSPIVQDVHESMKRLSTVYGKIDITGQIAEEMKKRHPDKKKIKRLESGKEKLALLQPLVKIDGIGVHEFGKKDKDAICYVINDPPPFYLHGALSRQMIQIPFEQLNTTDSKKTLTKEIRLLREYTRRNIETHLSMLKNGMKAGTLTYNKILDDTFRTSADPVENVEKVEMTHVVKNIPERKRYRLQKQILDYLDELKGHKVIDGYEVVKKKIPGKSKVVEYGFKIITGKKEKPLP